MCKNTIWIGGKCVGVCTDGTANMIGCHSSVTAKIREMTNQDLLITHCILHREHLSSKKMSPELNEVKIVNYIRGRALHSKDSLMLCMIAWVLNIAISYSMQK